MSAVPAFLLGVEEEEADDLAALGVDLNRPMSESEIDAAMSEMLRRMAWYDKQVAMAYEACTLEVERIRARYTRRMDPMAKRRAEIEAQALALAQRATFEGKKKSRDVGNGTFGKRTTPERVEVIDKPAAIEWAKKHHPSAVLQELVEKLVHKEIAPVVIERISETGEVPAGFDVHPADVVYFAKPEVD